MCHGCHEAANEEHPYFDKNKTGLVRDYLFCPVLEGGETEREQAGPRFLRGGGIAG
jgi:hypothetical protein